MNEEAGIRLRRFVDERMAARGVASIIELADTADVGRDTLYAWFRGRAPSPRPGGRVAAILGVTYRDLLAAYEGHEEAPPGDAQAGLVAGMADLTVAVGEVASWLRLRAETAGSPQAAESKEGPADVPTRAELDAWAAESRSNSELLGRLLEQVLQAETRLSALERTRE